MTGPVRAAVSMRCSLAARAGWRCETQATRPAKVRGKVGVPVAVRRVRPPPGGVVQDGPESVVVLAGGGRPLVDHQARQALPVAPAADAGLGRMHAEPLVGGAEQAVDPWGGDRAEERPQVDADDESLPRVGRGEGVHAAAGDEPVRAGVDRKAPEEVVEEPALQGPQAGLRRLDEPVGEPGVAG